MAKYAISEKSQKALKLWREGCLAGHQRHCEKLRQGHRAYRGLMDIASDAAMWTSKLHPPFAQHIIESTLAGLVDDKFAYRVKPAPRFYDEGEYDLIKQGAKAHEILHGAQLKADRFSEKQWPFAMEDAIGGLAVTKQYWRRERSIRPRLKVVPNEQAAAHGIFLPELVEVEELHVSFDGPVTEVVNTEDFYWHEAAVELQKSPVVAHRVWMHFTDLKAGEANGVYKDVDELRDSRDQQGDYTTRRAVDGSSRSKDMIEVLEIWWREDDGKIWCVTLGNQRVELRAPKPNPFWHGEYPFVVCTTRPDRFVIAGMSQIEKIAHLQEAHWDLENQTRDNVRLLNNAIFMFGEGVLDVDQFPFEPGARWPVQGDPNETVQAWTPNVIPAQLALPHLARLESQMQNLAGGQPFTSTSEANSIGADTATEAALATNLAQLSTRRLKQQLNFAYERMGQQRTHLNQQFIRTDVWVDTVGLDSQEEQRRIAPMLLQGDFLFDISPMNESLMRSERRAEANAMIQTLAQLIGPWYQLASQGAATLPNWDAFAERWLEGYDVGDTRQFFSSKPIQAPPQPAGQGGQPAGSGEVPGPGGTTAPQAIDPATSPSAMASLSGATMMQRALAARGGSANT